MTGFDTPRHDNRETGSDDALTEGSAVASVRTDPIPAPQLELGTPLQAAGDRPAVWAVGLAKSYGPTVALVDLDLEVAAGETVALLGPNGAGKTTTIGLLLGLLAPGRGQVRVYGRPPSQAVAAGLVGAMLQDAGLMPGVRVGELLAMVRGLYPRPLPLDELVGLADLGSLLRRRADRLSGGQAQRVRFAAAIAGDPLLLILDEPTAAMDVQARRNFWRQIHGFASQGRTVLFATHYLHEADDAADRVVVIAAGRKIADGPPAEIKADFGDQQVRFTLIQGSPELLDALDGVRAVEQDHSRVTLHSGDTDATVRSLISSGLRWSGLEVGGLDLETSFLRLLGDRT
jgi:ABC-2 type transport system ATP-binding protein